jgi:hypothetical protein
MKEGQACKIKNEARAGSISVIEPVLSVCKEPRPNLIHSEQQHRVNGVRTAGIITKLHSNLSFLMSSPTQHGYFLIADISGYTSFVAGTELEHAHEILTDLLETICGRIQTLLTIHKLEGDAVFAYAPESRIQRGETVLELIESTYVAFRDRQSTVQRATTCTCRACRNIPALDLKFIAHHGDYILQKVVNITEMVGSDVNLVHRLLKNHTSEATDWKAYALFTEKSLEHLGVQLENTHTQRETFEHLGDVITHSIDMHARYDEIISARRVVVEEKDADVVIHVDFPVGPPRTWEWINDPTRRNQWSNGREWSRGLRPRGRTGTGANNHCAHGKSVVTETILDWHPFEYATFQSKEHGKDVVTETTHLTLLPDGRTRLSDRMIFIMPLPWWLRKPLARFMIKRMFKYEQALNEAARLAGEEAASEQGALS